MVIWSKFRMGTSLYYFTLYPLESPSPFIKDRFPQIIMVSRFSRTEKTRPLNDCFVTLDGDRDQNAILIVFVID